MSCTPPTSARSSVLPVPSQRTIMRIWRGLKDLVMKPARHELAERELTAVRWHLFFENDVETTKKVVLSMLQKIWRYKISRAGDLSLDPEEMKLMDLEELWRLMRRSAFDNVPYGNFIHNMVITSQTSVGTSWSSSTLALIPDFWNIITFKLMRMLMPHLWPC